jgi:hypothetical protein
MDGVQHGSGLPFIIMKLIGFLVHPLKIRYFSGSSMQRIISWCKEGNYVMCGLILKPNNIILSERSQLRLSCSS